MKVMYCWRCQADTPMFDELEFEVLVSLYCRAVEKIKSRQGSYCGDARRQFILDQYRPVLEEYRRLTGQEWAGPPSDLIHHSIAKHGPLCHRCGKPLRTPKARHCAACGANRSRA
jgi:hypothetical protein